MKRFLVSAMTSAVLATMAPAAFAVVDLDDGTGSANYAKELVTPGVTALTGTGVNVTSTLGFGVSNGQTRYIRYDLTNAKFGAAVTVGDLVMASTTATIAQGGQAGSKFVIFQITAGADIAQSVTVGFNSAVTGLVIQSAGSAVQMAYSLYEDAPSAQAGGVAGRLNNNYAAQTVAGLVTGLAFSTAQNTTTVDVAQTPSYTHFLAIPAVAGTSTTVAQIGTVSIGAAGTPAAPVLVPSTGVQVTYADLVAAGTSLVLKGDFGAAVSPSANNAGVFLGGANCSVAGTPPTPATGITDTAIFVTGTAPQTATPVCFSVTAANTITIPAQTFTVEADITPAAGATTADLAPIDAGKFIRNGLVLKAAFAETTGVSGIARAISLSNTSNNPAPYTVRCLTNSGSVAGIAGTVPANSSTRQQLGTPGMGCPTNGTMRGIEITFASVPGSVVGSMVSQSTSTGAASYDAMTGNQ